MKYQPNKYVYYDYLGIIHRATKDGFNYFDKSKYKVEYFDTKTQKWIEDDFNLGLEVMNPDSNAIELTSASAIENFVNGQYSGNRGSQKNRITVEEIYDEPIKITEEDLKNITFSQYKILLAKILKSEYLCRLDEINQYFKENEQDLQKDFEDCVKRGLTVSDIESVAYGIFMMV